VHPSSRDFKARQPGTPAGCAIRGARRSATAEKRCILSRAFAACAAIPSVRRKRVEAAAGSREDSSCRVHVDARSSARKRQTMNARTETILFSVTAVLIVVLMVSGLQDIVAPSASSPAPGALVEAAAGRQGGGAAGLPAPRAEATPRG
jgi:hypothetical protein